MSNESDYESGNEMVEEDDPKTLLRLRTLCKRDLLQLTQQIKKLIDDRESRKVIETLKRQLLTKLADCKRINEKFAATANLDAQPTKAIESYDSTVEKAVQSCLINIDTYFEDRLVETPPPNLQRRSLEQGPSVMSFTEEYESLSRHASVKPRPPKPTEESSIEKFCAQKLQDIENNLLARIESLLSNQPRRPTQDDGDDFDARNQTTPSHVPTSRQRYSTASDASRHNQNPIQQNYPDAWIFERNVTGHMHNGYPCTGHLSKIDIKPFSGDPRDWPLFIANFKSMVHDVLPTDDQRIAYLRELLAPEVRKSIAHSLNKPSLYRKALQDLRRRYGNPQRICGEYIRALLELPNVRPNDFQSLKVFFNELHGAISMLDDEGYTEDVDSTATLEQLLTKLPNGMRSKWGRHTLRMKSHKPGLRDLDEWLEEIVVGTEVCPPITKPSRETPQKEPAKRADFKKNNASSKGLVLSTSIATSPLVTCSFCGESHRNSLCPKLQNMNVTQRIELVNSKKCCFRCLGPNHMSKDCKSTKFCNQPGCKSRHNPLLHGAPRIFGQNSTSTSTNNTASAASEITPHVGHVSQGNEERILLAVVPVTLVNGDKSLKTYALLDPGSQSTLIKQEAASTLGLQGEQRKIRPRTFHGKDPVFNANLVKLTIRSRDQTATFDNVKAVSVPVLNGPRDKICWPKEKLQWPHIADLDIPPHDASKITVLIGRNARGAHKVFEYREPPNGMPGPNAILTPFGWCIVDDYPTKINNDQNEISVFHVRLSLDDDLSIHDSLPHFWEMESSGTAKHSLLPIQEEKALKILQETTKNIGNRYEVALLWKNDPPTLPNNFEYALNRFSSLEKRLVRDANLCQRYEKTINEYVEAGYAEKVENRLEYPGRTWYLPHHAVVNPHKPGKVRVVFDASAKFQGTCLNDSLLKGPDFLTNLLKPFLLFRSRLIAVSADIAKMYHQVRVPDNDKSALRFIWKTPGSNSPPEVFQMRVHIFGAISSPSTCMFALQRTALDNRQLFPQISEKVVNNFYVDNYLDSFDTTTEAINVSRQLTELLSRGGFTLNKWTANSREVMKAIQTCDWINPNLNIDKEVLPTERTLGVLWDCENDIFVFQANPSKPATTKREVLSQVSSIYDPFGFLAPFCLLAKIILQSLWRHGTNWDDVLPPRLLDDWEKWQQSLQSLNQVTIPRCLRRPGEIISTKLHVFTDASEVGYGAVAYVRSTYTDGDPEIRFVLSKTRVAPIKYVTIPRLELCGAVLGARLAATICPAIALDPTKVTFWTDSKTTLQWIYSKNRKFKAFVGNRVGEILETTCASQWRHIPGICNPADICSRGSTVCSPDFRNWLAGPNFLLKNEEEWPPNLDLTEPEDDEVTVDPWVGAVKNDDKNVLTILLERNSNLTKALRIIAFVLRFVGRLKNATKPPTVPSSVLPKFLTANEIKKALHVCIAAAQEEHFSKDILAIKSNGSTFKESIIVKLNPFLDAAQILRVGGRLRNSTLTEEAKHPILLPHDHRVTEILVQQMHEAMAHSSTERTLYELRSQYWVIKGRQTIKTIVNRCAFCKKRKIQPVAPFMADLPAARLQPFNPPFTFTGIDLFGPLYVTVRRSTEKRWGCLFTCMTTRAVHLEICNKLDADSFLLSFRRFVARRRTPAKCFSDNGTNFIAGERELREGIANWNHEKIANAMAAKGIEWQFSPPSAPHFGGTWERLIKSAKSALQNVLKGQRCNEEILHTVFTEVESLLNGRPLTHLSMDPDDAEPLTPNHFLVGDPKPNIPPDVISDKEVLSRRRWRAAQAITNQFWRRWLKEYVPQLTIRKKWTEKRENVKEGDVVLVVDVNTPRGHWPVGRVLRVFSGKDGIVRTAEVKTENGIYVRPITKLCVFEST